MYYEQYGDTQQPTIVFLHCAGIVEIYLKQYLLAERYHIVVPHIYGSGKEVETDFNFEKSEKAIIDILKSIKKEKVYIVGHSEGANLAFALISHYPELFYKAVISSPMIDKSDRIAKMKAIYFSAMSGILKSKWMGKAFIKLIGIDDKARANFFLSYWTKISKTTWQNYFTDRITFEMCPLFKNLTLPILCILGTKEPKIISQTIQRMQEINNNCQVRYIQNAGHEHPVKKADELQKTIIDYFCEPL